MKMQTWLNGAGLCAVALLGAAGCQDKNDNGMPDTPATGAQIEKSLEKTGDAVENAVDGAVPAIKNAGSEVVGTAEDIGTTGKVKSALIADKTISATEINVTTKDAVVHLQGTVKNAAQKNLVSQIAKKAAGSGYTIKNQLVVAGGSSPMMKKN